ncbi:MAG: hypothetical protein U1F71_10020 [Verrucomicrobiaceae bacterium]
MMNLTRLLSLVALSGLLPSCETFRENKLHITCHVQTNEIEHPSEIMTLPIGGQNLTFKKVPEFSQHTIAAFEPFPAEEGQGFGVLLQLDARGRQYLEIASRQHPGMIMLTMAGTKHGQIIPVDMVELDKPITDGRFTIWRGLSQETIKDMDKFYPRLKHMKSSSRWMDMLPSTDKEKLDARRAGKEAEAAEARAQRDKERGIVPKAPKTKDIPIEGFKLPGT